MNDKREFVSSVEITSLGLFKEKITCSFGDTGYKKGDTKRLYYLGLIKLHTI
ncbi:hypothetical protein P4361_08070 [Fictibacillus sp. B-59209]|uniref:hypothetical protein n=1 Tax=Fictibacillus sp. B-59209 TaxID=3024873 RepID=UPI002E238D9F|nr:hypothetical protein [Fictibacillus sp. B-59209]